MIVVMIKATVLVSRPLIRVSLQLAGKCQGFFVLDSIEAVNGVKLVNVPVGGLEGLSSRHSPVLAIFCPLSSRTSFCLSLFMGFSSQASNMSSAFMYLVAL